MVSLIYPLRYWSHFTHPTPYDHGGLAVREEKLEMSVTELATVRLHVAMRRRQLSSKRLLIFAAAMLVIVLYYTQTHPRVVNDKGIWILLALGMSTFGVMHGITQMVLNGVTTSGIIRAYTTCCAWYSEAGKPCLIMLNHRHYDEVRTTDWSATFDDMLLRGQLTRIKPGTRPEISYGITYIDRWSRRGFHQVDAKEELANYAIGTRFSEPAQSWA